MKNRENFTLGLALGSGGAKGMAHVGAIKAFEEEGLDFKIISGTSIGSIVGAFYAKGYSADDMLSLLNEIDLSKIKLATEIALGIVDIYEIIFQFLGGAYFSDLKKDFSVVAVDALKGEEVVFTEGDLSMALASSSAVPPIKPILHDGKILVDGAFLNYVPADLVRYLGADFVLSINLGKGKDTNQEIKSKLDKTLPENKIPYTNRSKKCYQYSDYVIHPNLSKFSSFSLGSLESMYEIGYETAKREMKEILKTIKTRKRYKS